MTGAIHSRPSASSPAPGARFGAALAASAFAHWLLLSAPLLDLQGRGIAPGPDGVPITVRLAPAPVHAPDIPAIPDPEARRPEKWGQVKFSASASQTPSQKIGPDPIFPDPNYYPARELDDYPRPLAPLRIDRPAGAGGGEVRLEILIDERGVVRDVIFAGAVPPGGAEEGLRAMLAATRFLPALKDGRAVRSRVMLRLGFDSEDGKL